MRDDQLDVWKTVCHRHVSADLLRRPINGVAVFRDLFGVIEAICDKAQLLGGKSVQPGQTQSI